MEELTLINHTYELISRDFGIEKRSSHEEEKTEEEKTFEWLSAVLKERIDYLLDHQFNELLNMLYRIDINESLVNAILYQPSPDRISKDLAEAVLRRQRQKVLTRLRYRT